MSRKEVLKTLSRQGYYSFNSYFFVKLSTMLSAVDAMMR